ncbi:MAG: hypothetical protein PHV93_04555 [Candidatus Pacebacteria bacterium]|nr:hypothetical protein [Candidatus Paceibacterota bacterium]
MKRIQIKAITCPDCTRTFFGDPRRQRCPECGGKRTKMLHEEWKAAHPNYQKDYVVASKIGKDAGKLARRAALQQLAIAAGLTPREVTE